MGGTGTAAQPITVRGVLGPGDDSACPTMCVQVGDLSRFGEAPPCPVRARSESGPRS